MAAPIGRSDSSLTGSELERLLAEEPWEVSFFQAVRLLERFSGRRPVGGFTPPSEEAARFAGDPSLGFPPSEIRALVPRPELPPLMRVSFFGLYGAMGVLPHVYTEFIQERAFGKDTAFRDFLDLFNHRLVAFVYRAWFKYRLAIAWERSDDEIASRELSCLLGLGTPGLQDRQEISDETLIFYAGLVARQSRSAAGLEALIGDYFDLAVRVLPFAGAWRELDRSSWTCFGDPSPSNMLGQGVVLGDEVWDQQSTVRLRVGPLTLDRYESLLPTGAAYPALRSLCRFYCGQDVDVELQLVLRREDVPSLGLETGGPGPRLGWVSWLVSRPPEQDKDDTLLLLWNPQRSPS